jgi:hypothetical protein
MTDEKRPIYLGSPDWEAEPEQAVALARMERLAEVRIAVGELEVARYAAEATKKIKKVANGK